MLLRELLAIDVLGLRLLTPETDAVLDRPVRRVFTTDLRDPGRYLTGDDLVLSGLIWHRGPDDSAEFAALLAARGACALGAGQVLLGHIPEDLIAACRRYDVPLFAVPVETSFATITEHVSRRLSGEWGGALSRVLGRHRRLVSAVAEGAGLDALFRLLADDLGVDCRLITPTGHVLAGTAPLPPVRATRLARGYLTAERLPRVLRDEDADVTVYPVASTAGHRVTSWFVACAGDEERWTDERRESVRELVAGVAFEQARLEAAAGVRHRLAARLIELITTGDTGSAELTSLAGTLGLDTGAPGYAVVALGLSEMGLPEAGVSELGPPASTPAAAGPSRTGSGPGLPASDPAPPGLPAAGIAGRGASARGRAGPGSGLGRVDDAARVARDVLGELLRGTGSEPVIASGADLPERLGGVRAAVAVVPLDEPDAGPLAGRVRTGAAALEAGLGGLRLTAGVSGPAPGMAALRGAMDEALSALRLADARPGRAVAVSADEIDSHVLLLASVPDEVRRTFRDRLLGPLLDYDERHGAQLMPTLEAFLAASGSWQACAAQLHVHVNTLRYRIQRIERITGRDLGSLESRVDFFLATRAGRG